MRVVVPDLGDFADVEIIEILVKAGDVVAPEDPLISLETEKAAMDVPSPTGGTVKSVEVAVGDKVSAGDLIAVIDADETAEAATAGDADKPKQTPAGAPAGATKPAGEAERAESPRPAAPAGSQAPDEKRGSPSGPAPSAGRFLMPVDEAGFSRAHASPSVRKLGRELGVDLGRVDGSGAKGRVTAADVKAYVKQIMSRGGAGPALPQVPEVDFARFGPVRTEPLGRIQRISGPRLHASWVNIPHVTQHDEADITTMEETRQELKQQAAERNIRLTPLAFVLRACVLALGEFPRFKASLGRDGQTIVLKDYMHVGFAADTPNGLVVPVIRDADDKDVYELAESLAELSERARAGRLKPDDMQGGVFTISSLGGIGGTFFTPIINAPEVAILGVSRHYFKPVWTGDTFAPRLMLPLSLSYDHRVIDGAEAVRFTTRLGELLGDVDRLLEAIP